MDPVVQKKLEAFFKEHQKLQCKKGELLIQPHQSPCNAHLLTEGIVRMYSLTKEGDEVTLNMFKPLSFFPVGCIINKTQNKYYYDCLAPSTLYVAPKQKFLSFLRNEHDVAFDLLKRIFRGLDGYFMQMEYLLAGNAYYKTILELIIQAQRYGSRDKKSGSYLLHLTHNQLASLAGLSRETVTREIKKLQNKKLIEYKGETLVIPNLNMLMHELS